MKVEKVSFKSDETLLKGELYMPGVKSESLQPTVCVCHGIPSVVKLERDPGYPALATRFVEEGFITLIFNFRGTGLSKGEFDYFGWCEDLKSAVSFLDHRKEVDGKRLAVVGFSGGAVTSIYTATLDERIKAVVVGACPINMERLGRVIVESCRFGSLRVKTTPEKVEKLNRDLIMLEPLKWVDKISPRPILIVHGEKDELIEVTNAYRLYDKAKNPKKLIIIPNAQHRLRLNKEAVESILNWLKETLQLNR